MRAAVGQLDPGEGAVPVRLLGHEREVARVVLVPDRCETTGQKSESGLTSASSVQTAGPAALGLHAAEVRLRARLLAPEARAVRHLVEAVPQRLRPDLDRLEEDVVAGIARHGPG